MNDEPPNVLFCMYYIVVYKLQRLGKCVQDSRKEFIDFEKLDSEIRKLAVSHPSVQKKKLRKLEVLKRNFGRLENMFVLLTRMKNELKTDVCQFNSYGFEKRKVLLKKWKESILRECLKYCAYCYKKIARNPKPRICCQVCSPLSSYCSVGHRKNDRENHTYFMCSMYFTKVAQFELTQKFQNVEDERMSYVDGRKRLELLFEETERRSQRMCQLYRELEIDNSRSLGEDLKNAMLKRLDVERRGRKLNEMQNRYRRFQEELENCVLKKRELMKVVVQENQKKRDAERKKKKKQQHAGEQAHGKAPVEDVETDIFKVSLDFFLKNDVCVLLGRLFSTLKEKEEQMKHQNETIAEMKEKVKVSNASLFEMKKKLTVSENRLKSLELKMNPALLGRLKENGTQTESMELNNTVSEVKDFVITQ